MSYRKMVHGAAMAAILAAAPAFGQQAAIPPEEPIRTIPAQVDADARAAIAGINAFSLDLYRRTLADDENHFLSPASVSVAVGLAYRGARGRTATELDQTLHFGKLPNDYLRADGQVLETMTFAGPRRELRTANALWLQEGMPLVHDYEHDLAAFAKVGLHRVDFRQDADAARGKVNGRVADSTNGKIRDLLQPDQVTQGTRAILVNAIYWKGAWLKAFDKAQTRPEKFTQLSGAEVTMPVMHQRSDFQVVERRGIKAILLPYEGGEVDMAVFLPNSAKGLPAFEAKLTASDLSNWLDALQKAEGRDTILTLPKLHLEWRQDLKQALEAMGAPTAFSDEADFSGMATSPYPGEDPRAVGLKISHVIHQANVDVDEVGSEAAAATAVIMDVIITGARRGPPPPPPVVFSANKPFLFLLRDRRTGLVLFMGRYVKAQAGAGASG